MNFKSNIPLTEPTFLSNWSNKFLENKVRFSLKYTESKKHFCLRKCSKEEIQSLYSTLWEKEDLTWQQIRSIWREKWISIEKKDDSNHKMLKDINKEFNTFWHLRIKNTWWLWRIFWWIKDDLFYIILIDIKWAINH